jgi:hypothetical protein
MDVEWSFSPVDNGTHVRLYHVWNGPAWPMIGEFAATTVIGPVFIHGIASRTLEGLARIAEREPATNAKHHSVMHPQSAGAAATTSTGTGRSA